MRQQQEVELRTLDQLDQELAAPLDCQRLEWEQPEGLLEHQGSSNLLNAWQPSTRKELTRGNAIPDGTTLSVHRDCFPSLIVISRTSWHPFANDCVQRPLLDAATW
jgi:hypothetical protein